ncbi:hypothetical protein C9374_006336 [Naegleria lovaniensis]|uniref:Uncharacterized protein n=1 Tax=Naegleria lovaniensis TaxID=51637 RepID=A0AA88KHP1_NAELO|nr:uncharacterized protein C9374_006336 [Naegleria lovaniensis]KAG2381347.1 hypothetical protein C9374_006336 [Naegleria lovaniensis]
MSTEQERKLVVFLFKQIMKICRTYDQYPLLKTSLINPSYTKSESIMTRGWAYTKIGKEVIEKIYGKYSGLMYVPRWNVTTLHETSKLTDICKQTFRNPKFVEDEKSRKEGFEVGFGILSEFNSHLERIKTIEKKEIMELRKLSPAIQVPIKVLNEDVEMVESESNVFQMAKDSMTDMKDDERLQQIAAQPHNQDKLDGSDMYLVLTDKPRKNHLLVAHPLLEDTRFERTVVRMDNNKQTLGYIIGKLTFSEKEDEDDNNDYEENIEKLMGDDSEKESSSSDHVMDAYKKFSKMFPQEAIENEPERIAKWYETQLENEIKDGKWIVVEADMESMLPFGAETPYYQVWEYIVKRLGGEYLSWIDYFSHKQPTPLKRPNAFPNVRIIVL